jgi:hypothetical protein
MPEAACPKFKHPSNIATTVLSAGGFGTAPAEVAVGTHLSKTTCFEQSNMIGSEPRENAGRSV